MDISSITCTAVAIAPSLSNTDGPGVFLFMGQRGRC